MGVSAHSENFSGQTAATITYGCAAGSDYRFKLGIILKEKGVFGILLGNSFIETCFTNRYKNSELEYFFRVDDTHEEFYQKQPLASVGLLPDSYLLMRLANKSAVVINVE